MEASAQDYRGFVEDMTAQDLHHAVVIRSPVASGVLESVETPRLPHTYSLIRGTDIPGKNRLDGFSNTVALLAADRVSYIGEPVALLVGPDRGHLEQYLQGCTVKVREEKQYFSCDGFSSDRLAAKRTLASGDTDRAFKDAHTVVEGNYRTGRQEHWYAEPHGAMAYFSYDKLVIHVATQWPFMVRRTVAAAIGVKPEDVVVKPTEIGAHLDGKLWYPALIAAHAALATLLSKKPVKILLTREEDFRFTPKRGMTDIRLRSALGKNGELLALEARSILDVGAGGPFAEEMLERLCVGTLGTYRCPNLRIEGFAVKTNTPPAGPFSGLGLSQAFFAMERQACKIAESLGRDPAEWKREQSMASPGPELIDAVCTMSDYHRKWASYEMLRKQRLADETPLKNQPLRGIGVSLVYQGTGFLASGADKGYFGVEMTLEKDGSLEIRTSAVACSQETAALWRRIAADQLALDAGMVRIGQNSTDMVPDSGPSSLSRNISVITRLIERSCAAIKKQRFRDPLPITVQRSYKPAKASKEQDFHVDGAAFNQLGWGVVVVEAEIDPIDYSPRVRGVWMMVDGGRILSERKARSSLKISIGQALSWASREHIQYTQGSLSSMDAFLYDIPSVEDDPPIHIDFFLNDGALAKGIGELPFSCVPAAFAQAVSQAAGPSFDILPITANMVRESLLRNAEPGEAGTP